MTLRHIQVFLAVVDNGCSITKAAEQLHLAQPAVSQTIADMEQFYQVQLFDRLNRKLYITSVGKKLLPYARRATDDFSVLYTILKEGNVTLPVRIGATLTTGTVVLPVVLKKLSKYQKVPIRFEVIVRNTQKIEQALLDSRIDVAIVEGKILSGDIIRIPVPGDMLCAVCAPDYHIRPGEKQVWILRETGSGTRALTEEFFNVPVKEQSSDAGIWSIGNTQTSIELAKAGLGIAVLSRLLVKKELENGSLTDCTRDYLKDELAPASFPGRSFSIAYHKDKLIDVRMQNFIRGVQQYAAEE